MHELFDINFFNSILVFPFSFFLESVGMKLSVLQKKLNPDFDWASALARALGKQITIEKVENLRCFCPFFLLDLYRFA